MALTQVTSAGLKDGEIVNADLHSAASVALSKLASTGALGSAVTATTQSASDDSTKLATTAFVQAAVTSLIDGAPGSLNTLNELAAAINDDSSYATTLTTALATKLPLAGGNVTGTIRIGANSTTASTAGDDLVIEGSSDRGLSIISGTSSSGNIYFGDSSDADIGRFAYQHNDNAFDFHTNAGGTAKFRIASNGALIQKAASGDNQFYSQRTNAAGSNGNYFFHLKAQDSSGNNVGEAGFHRDTAVDDARFVVHTRNSGGSSQERLRITSGGSVNIGANLTQTTYPFSVQKDLDSGGNLAYFANSDGTYNQGITLSFDSNKDIKWAGGSGSGGLIWNMGTRGYVWQIGGSDKLRIDSSGNLQINNDSGKITLGTGADLQLFHDGGSSIIRNTNNNASLYLQGSSSGTNNIRCYANGGTVLYWNGETNLYTAEDAVRINDDIKFEIGNASDLKIFHNGDKSYIKDEGTGSLRICTNDFRVYNAADNEFLIRAVEDGAVQLFYAGGERIRTTQTGIDFYGRITTDTNNSLVAHFGTTNSTGGYVRYGLAHNGGTIGFIGSPTQLLSAGDQDDLGIRAQSDIRFATGGSTLRCTIDTSGNFYPATTNASNLGAGSLRWNQGYLNKLSLNTSNTNTNFCINGAGSANVMTIRNTTGGNGNVGILFSTQDHSGGREKAAIYHQETHGSAHYGGDFIFCLNSATGSAGQVGPSDVRLRVTRGGAALANNTCKAYINFNQGNNNIRLGYNIASITDNGTGQHRITFTNAMDNNYYTVVSGGSREQPEASRCYPTNIDGMNNGYFDATNHNDGSTNVDWELCCLAVYGLGGD